MLSTILKCNQTFMFGINEGIQNNPPPSPATNQKKPYISIFNILKIVILLRRMEDTKPFCGKPR